MSLVLLSRKSDLEYLRFQETVKLCYSTMKSIHLITSLENILASIMKQKQWILEETNDWESEKQQTGQLEWNIDQNARQRKIARKKLTGKIKYITVFQKHNTPSPGV